jgi:putative protein kinase ArgK-like GTPase of G3E family
MAPRRSLGERLLEGEPAALARAITLVERGRPDGYALVRSICPACSSARWPAGAPSGGLAEAALQATLLMDAAGRQDAIEMLVQRLDQHRAHL